jgi:CDP-glycerol glycerophosphotransferase (TagB/SpsB family)
MTNNSNAKPVDDLSNRSLKKIGELDPKTFESNKEKEIEIKSEKKQKVEKWYVYLDSNTSHLRKWKDTN